MLIFLSNAVWSQSVFDKFENQEGVTALVVNKKMFSLLSEMDAKDVQSKSYKDLLKRLDNLKVFTTTNDNKSDEMKAAFDKHINSEAVEKLVHVNEKGKNVRIYVKPGTPNTQIKELFLFTEGSGSEESVLMSLIGNFKLNELSLLTDKMKLPGREDLKKASKANK